MSAQAAADLRAAADVLERDGWTQFVNYNRSTHCRCAAGAIYWAAGHREGRARYALNAASDYVERNYRFSGIVAYNDAPDRGAGEVIAALRAAADAAEADQ